MASHGQDGLHVISLCTIFVRLVKAYNVTRSRHDAAEWIAL